MSGGISAALFNEYINFKFDNGTPGFDIMIEWYEINVAFVTAVSTCDICVHVCVCVDVPTRGIFRRAHYTELSGHGARRVSQRPSRRGTHSRPALRKSLRATDNDSFRSAVDGDHVNQHRQQLDALVFLPLSILAIAFFFVFSPSLSEERDTEEEDNSISVTVRWRSYFDSLNAICACISFSGLSNGVNS